MTTDRPDPPSFEGRNAIEHADTAAEAVRAINHITGWTGGGLIYPADAYAVLARVAAFAAMLPQALAQIDRRILDWHTEGHIGIDRGTEFGGRPGNAVTTASNALWHACDDAVTLYGHLDAAAQALANAHWTGPEPGQP